MENRVVLIQRTKLGSNERTKGVPTSEDLQEAITASVVVLATQAGLDLKKWKRVQASYHDGRILISLDLVRPRKQK